MKEIGKRIRELRQRRGLSQEVLGEKTGISQTYLSDLELGKANVDAADLWQIAKALGFPINQFFPPVNTTISNEIEWEEVCRFVDGKHEFATYKRLVKNR